MVIKNQVSICSLKSRTKMKQKTQNYNNRNQNTLLCWHSGGRDRTMMANKASLEFQASQDFIGNSFHQKGKVRRREKTGEKRKVTYSH